MYKEDLNKVAKKKMLWENMAVLIHSHHILFMSSKEIVIKFLFGISGSSGADGEQGLWLVCDAVHEGNRCGQRT